MASMSLNPQMKAAPTNLLERLTPLENKRFRGDFKAIVRRLVRPYYRLSPDDYDAVREKAGTSDVLLFDGRIQVTYGEADGGYALMPLQRPI